MILNSAPLGSKEYEEIKDEVSWVDFMRMKKPTLDALMVQVKKGVEENK